jgi:hypothetical protein
VIALNENLIAWNKVLSSLFFRGREASTFDRTHTWWSGGQFE